MNEIATTKASDTFRAIAADRLKSAADMSLHELADEFVRLTKVIEGGKEPASEEYEGYKLSDDAKVAERERQIVNGAARSRFGIGFNDHDFEF